VRGFPSYPFLPSPPPLFGSFNSFAEGSASMVFVEREIGDESRLSPGPFLRPRCGRGAPLDHRRRDGRSASSTRRTWPRKNPELPARCSTDRRPRPPALTEPRSDIAPPRTSNFDRFIILCLLLGLGPPNRGFHLFLGCVPSFSGGTSVSLRVGSPTIRCWWSDFVPANSA